MDKKLDSCGTDYQRRRCQTIELPYEKAGVQQLTLVRTGDGCNLAVSPGVDFNIVIFLSCVRCVRVDRIYENGLYRRGYG